MSIPTPYYEANLSKFKSNATMIIDAFKSRYANYNLAYCFKTNCFPSFLEIANETGLYAEVASTKEYSLALKAGFSKDKIIWNGVIPDYSNKNDVLTNGGLVHFDNLIELHDTCGENNIPVGVRFNFDIGNGIQSRFGITIGSEEFNNLLNLVKIDGLQIRSVHCHISYARDLQSFKKRIETMCSLAKIFNASIIDIGGNMYGPMSEDFMLQYNEYIPTIDEYAEIVCAVMNREFPNQEVMLITENGTPVASTAMDLICTVIGEKEVNGIRYFTLDCKHSDVGFSCNNKNPTIEEEEVAFNTIEHAKIFGCSCLERDIIHRDYSGNLHLGSKVRIKNVGAYGYNIANDFITSIPPVNCVKY